MNDLLPQMQLKGTIRNVVDFGIFVDIGIKADGLLQQSKISRGTKLRVGDINDTVVLSINPKDPTQNRITLDMKVRYY